jgi:hypothetical protein
MTTQTKINYNADTATFTIHLPEVRMSHHQRRAREHRIAAALWAAYARGDWCLSINYMTGAIVIELNDDDDDAEFSAANRAIRSVFEDLAF